MFTDAVIVENVAEEVQVGPALKSELPVGTTIHATNQYTTNGVAITTSVDRQCRTQTVTTVDQRVGKKNATNGVGVACATTDLAVAATLMGLGGTAVPRSPSQLQRAERGGCARCVGGVGA